MVTLERKPTVLRSFGISKSTLHNLINTGLFPAPIQIGSRSVAWPSNEVETLINAKIAGKSLDEIRLLVKVLVKKRKEAGVA